MQKHKSDDWKPGDLGLCIKVGSWMPSSHIRGGQYVTVEATTEGLFSSGPAVGLILKEDQRILFGNRYYYKADRFIKINPEDLDEKVEKLEELKV